MKARENQRFAKLIPVMFLLMVICSSAASELEIETYAGLTITGEIGGVYSIEYVNEIADEQWKCLEFEVCAKSGLYRR